jgi:hypothetical protein
VTRYDAVLVPVSVAGRKAGRGRFDAIADTAEHWLGVDRAAGELAHIRVNPKGSLSKVFATRDPGDSILFPVSHPLSGRPRYRWESREDGVELGTLLTEQEAEGESLLHSNDVLIRRNRDLERRIMELERKIATAGLADDPESGEDEYL